MASKGPGWTGGAPPLVGISHPPPGMGPPPPPPPPGAPRAPGAPPAPGFASPSSSPNNLPYGMKQKKKYQLGIQTKRLYWNKVQANKMDKEAFWVNVHEDKFEDQNLLEGLLENFAFAVKEKKTEGTKKKAKELKLLDPKSAQNLCMYLNEVHINF